MTSCLNGLYMKMFKFSFEKKLNVQIWTKNEQENGAEEYMEKKVSIIFGNRM